MAPNEQKKLHVLFMCVANSARSQLAEGLAREQFGANAVIKSAGTHPSKLNPLAVRAMKEVGIDISDHHSKPLQELSPQFIAQLDYVITLCAEEVCPTLISKARHLHWPIPDPAGVVGTEEERLQAFRNTRDAIQAKLKELTPQKGLFP